MELVEKIRFAMATLKPMAMHTLPFVCQILGTNDRRSGELFGSGFRCVLGGKKVIVSAAHVIPDGRSKFKELAVSIGDGESPLILDDLCHDPESDLSISRLSDGDLNRGSVSYWPEDRIDQSLDRLSTDYLFVHGFPRVRSRPLIIPGGSRVVSQSLPYGVMQRLDDLPDHLVAFQFAMDFEPENAETEGGEPESVLFEGPIGPRGMSGSPVWRIGVSGGRAADWAPDCCKLVGIVTGWRPTEKLLIATKVTKLLELVHSNPEMTDKAQPA